MKIYKVFNLYRLTKLSIDPLFYPINKFPAMIIINYNEDFGVEDIYKPKVIVVNLKIEENLLIKIKNREEYNTIKLFNFLKIIQDLHFQYPDHFRFGKRATFKNERKKDQNS